MVKRCFFLDVVLFMIPMPALAQPFADTLDCSETLNCVAFSPDGRLIACGTADNKVFLFNLPNGQPKAMLETRGHCIHSAKFSAGDRFLVVHAGPTRELWDLSPGREGSAPQKVSAADIDSSSQPIVMSHNGQWVVACSGQSRSLAVQDPNTRQWVDLFRQDCQLWDARTGEVRKVVLTGRRSLFGGLRALSSNGQLLATVGKYYSATSEPPRTIRQIWDMATGTPRGEPLEEPVPALGGPGASTEEVILTPNGRWWIERIQGRSSGLYRWDIGTGKVERTPIPLGLFTAPVLSRDGTVLVAPLSMATVQLYDVEKWQALGKPIEHPGRVRISAVALSPDAKVLATAGYDATRLWDVATGNPVGQPMTPPGTAVAFSGDGQRLATITGRQAHVYRVSTVPASMEPVQQRPETRDTVPGSAEPLRQWPDAAVTRFGPDSKLLVIGGGEEQVIQLTDPATGQTVSPSWRAPKGEPILNAAFGPKGDILATVSEKSIRLWRVSTGQPIGLSLDVSKGLSSAAFSPDGTLLAGLSGDGNVYLWEVATGKLQKELTPSQPMEMTWTHAVFSPDGRFVAVGGILLWRFWDVAAGRPADGIPELVLAFSADWRFFLGMEEVKATCEGDAPKLARLPEAWAVSGSQRRPTPLPSTMMLQFSPDGRLLATVPRPSDYRIRLFETATNRPLGQMQVEGRVIAMVFSPDGRLLAAMASGFEVTQLPQPSNVDKSVSRLHLWDTATGQPCGAPRVCQGGILAMIEFSPDGRFLLTSLWGRGGQLWSVPNGDIPLAEMQVRTQATVGARSVRVKNMATEVTQMLQPVQKMNKRYSFRVQKQR